MVLESWGEWSFYLRELGRRSSSFRGAGKPLLEHPVNLRQELEIISEKNFTEHS